MCVEGSACVTHIQLAQVFISFERAGRGALNTRVFFPATGGRLVAAAGLSTLDRTQEEAKSHPCFISCQGVFLCDLVALKSASSGQSTTVELAGARNLGARLSESFFFDEALSKKSPGPPGDCSLHACVRYNGVSDAFRRNGVSDAAPRSRQFGGKIVSFLFLTRIFSKKVWAARRPVPESAAYEAKRRLGRVSQHRKVPLPQGPSNLGGKLRAVNFFFDENFSGKSGQPGPSNLGGNCEPFFFDETFFKKFAPESAAYEAKRRLGRVSQHRKVPLCPQAPAIWGENSEPCFFFCDENFSRKSGQPGPSNLRGNCEPFFLTRLFSRSSRFAAPQSSIAPRPQQFRGKIASC